MVPMLLLVLLGVPAFLLFVPPSWESQRICWVGVRVSTAPSRPWWVSYFHLTLPVGRIIWFYPKQSLSGFIDFAIFSNPLVLCFGTFSGICLSFHHHFEDYLILLSDPWGLWLSAKKYSPFILRTVFRNIHDFRGVQYLNTRRQTILTLDLWQGTGIRWWTLWLAIIMLCFVSLLLTNSAMYLLVSCLKTTDELNENESKFFLICVVQWNQWVTKASLKLILPELVALQVSGNKGRRFIYIISVLLFFIEDPSQAVLYYVATRSMFDFRFMEEQNKLHSHY
jgi:hypothetical protein